ncbi:serine/arginine repetitive matrix protein 2 [Platichthys flesus]|uniref:serine/arginine repetitive matrix protein 2 n=1 Tax=Platichthys flesus TaxID=8260 RepID=UPI002DB89E7D|nr:serine/arginine repetitive matrix protein 2 [Platichthys flesus]
MDSWTLQGDSYSFLRSAPRTFTLCHRDGTPNHVELFDIINVPTQRSAISETTCLCDIFGDDCESPSLSSSPAVGAFVLSKREVDGTAAASPLVDDLNDSGSYHTAHGSSEGEEGSEDSRERFYSPPLQSPSSERCQLEGEGLSSELLDISEDSSPNLERKSKSPVPQLSRASPPPEALNTGERTPFPGDKRSYTITPEGRTSPSSSSAEEIRHSPSPPSPRQNQLEAEPKRLTPVLKDTHNSPAQQFLNPSPCSEPRTSVSSASTESVNTQSSLDLRVTQNSPHPRNEQSSPLPKSTPEHFSLDFAQSAFESKAHLSSPIPGSSSTESHSRETSVTPERKNKQYSPNTQASSPFLEHSRRVSLPDLFSRGYTPDIEEPPQSPELILNTSSAERDTTTTPERPKTGLSFEGGSTVSTPAPRYTPPSPVISVTTSPELLETSVSPEFRHRAPSPGLLSAASPVTTGTRSPSPGPSPKIRSTSTSSANRSQVSSPVVSYTLSPSPGARSFCSPVEHRHTAPSPEIRITASSPELLTRSSSSRSLDSSPHITGISYSIVQPEERDTPPFPELSRLSTPEPHRTLVSQEAGSRTHSRGSVQSSTAGSTGTPRDSPHTSGFPNSVLQPEITLSYEPRYYTPSPQPQQQTPTPEPGYQTPSSQKHQSPSPQHLQGKELSLVFPSPEQRSPATLFAEYRSQHTQPTTPLRNTPEFVKESSSGDITEIQYPTHSSKDVSPLFELDKGLTAFLPEIKSSSPVVIVSSPVFTSPFLAEDEIASSFAQQSTEIEAQTKEVNIHDNLSLVSFSEEKQNLSYNFFPKEDRSNSPTIEIKSHSPNVVVSKDRSPIISPVHRATSISPVQRLEKPQPPITSRSPNSEKSSFLKSSCTPELSRRHPSTKVKNRESFTENMAHRAHRRRTPSPPLTRFTPVHIIAPEKPYRQWQNRSHSPSQVVASSLSGNLNTAVTNRENPNVAPGDNNSQAYCGRGGPLEMDREMHLEEERAVVRERQRDREMKRERKREERVPEKGEGWQGDASYRGEQVELSFNARNRKGPASRSAAPTSRETRQGLPTVHSCSESLLATRQLQQQQSLLRLSSQQDPRGGGPGRRLQPPTHQNKKSALGRTAASRPCRSSSSSMGSELDEADDEVKWFTDSAFRSLSSPEVDYLDMYNSSHRSSTNISQPSTQESPAGVNPTWQAYADFRGSAPKLDNDELSFQQSSAYCSDGLDPSRRYELGSFECVDVSLERNDTRKSRRGVPKRQIQLMRKNNADGKQDESSENSSPGIPVMVESPSLESHTRETLMRQHSTPAVTQDRYRSECSPEPNPKNERRLKLQKSASLDETCSKTKLATCLIKSVLSKKMQCVDKESDDQAEDVSPAFDENSPPTESTIQKVSPNPDRHNLSSTPLSDYGLSPECLPLRGDPSTKDEAKSLKSFGMRTSNRPSSSSSSRSVNLSQTDSEDADPQSRNATALRSDMRSELKVPFDSKMARNGVQRADGIKICEEREGGDSANFASGNTGAAFATGAGSRQARTTNRDRECENTEDHKQLQEGDEAACTSRPQQRTLRAVEKKKTSLNVCLTPEVENKLQAPLLDITNRVKEDRAETSVPEKTEEDEGNANNKIKAPIHKVRDVRQLVKNTYNLSFKAPPAGLPSDVNDEKMETFIEERREEVKEKRRKDVIVGNEHGVSQEIRMEEREEAYRAEREEEKKEEVKDSKLLTFPPPLQSKAKPLHRPQPMQIEYKAVCWKEDKYKMSCSKKANPDDKPQASPERVTEVSRESQREKNTIGDTTNGKSCQHGLKKAAETQEAVAEMHKMPDKAVEPIVVTTDRKPPLLGSLPKPPIKEREVSTAVVLIREGSKTSASPVQEKIPTPIQVPAPSLSPGPTTPGSRGHSVSLLLKEKGYQADIGAVVGGDVQNSAGGKGPPRKHVNCMEIPLQTTLSSIGGRGESQRERTFSSSSTMSGLSSVSENTDTLTNTIEAEVVNIKPPIRDVGKQKSTPPPLRYLQEQTPYLTKQKKDVGDFEAVKRLDPTFPPRSPAIRRFRPQPIEVKSLSTETQKQEMPTNTTVNNRLQTIEVKSIAKNSAKPIVPPKPSCKFKPADVGATPNEAVTVTSTVKPQVEERAQTIVVSSPTIYRKISNDSTATSNYTRKLAVSAVSSLKPPPSKTTATTISNLSNQSTAPTEIEACNDRGQQQPAALPQSSRYIQRPTTLAQTSTTSPDLTSGPISELMPSQIPGPTSAGANQPSQPAVVNPDSQPVHPRMACPHEQTMPATSNNVKHPAAVHMTHVPGYTRQSYRRTLSGECTNRADDLRFYASDDPPSYDERESFSPLMLPDLSLRRSNRYQPSSHHPPCSCTAGCPSHPGLTAPHHHHSPHNLTPPTPPHSPGQALPYQGPQPPLRPHQFRPDPLPRSYQPSSPKSSPLGPGQPSTQYQPLHQPPPCPTHPSLMQACTADRPLQPPQHIDLRRGPMHRSPQQQPPGMAGALYSDPGHNHSPGLSTMDPQYLCGPQSLGPSYGSDYGGDSSSLYTESSYGQAPRRVLLDPETGKYFYIEVPVQPLRKMLFDPETGQYVEVLIPQQAMSHSGLYPPSAAPYQSLHNPNMYAPAPQYMPYAAPPPPAHTQTQPQPPRYPEASAEATMHPGGPGVSYRNRSGQGSKSDSQNHPPLDQSYLESMYYVPTGMNASPNPTPPDYYHKHPPNLPPTGGKRS